jgi:hypothetical protein
LNIWIVLHDVVQYSADDTSQGVETFLIL